MVGEDTEDDPTASRVDPTLRFVVGQLERANERIAQAITDGDQRVADSLREGLSEVGRRVDRLGERVDRLPQDLSRAMVPAGALVAVACVVLGGDVYLRAQPDADLGAVGLVAVVALGAIVALAGGALRVRLPGGVEVTSGRRCEEED